MNRIITLSILFLYLLKCINSQFTDQFVINYLKKEDTGYNLAWPNVNLNYLFNLFCQTSDYYNNYELLYTKTISHFIPNKNSLKKNNFIIRSNYEIEQMRNYSAFGQNNSPLPDSIVDVCQDHYEEIRIPSRNYLKIQNVMELEFNNTQGLSIEQQTQQNARVGYNLLLTRVERAYNIYSKPSRLQFTGQLFLENAFLYLAAIFEGIYNGNDMGVLDHLIYGIEEEDGSVDNLGTLDERLNELSLDVLNKYNRLQNNLIAVQRSLCLLGLICVYPSTYNLPTWNRLTSIFWYSNNNYYDSQLYFISDVPVGHNNLSSVLNVDLNKYEYAIYVIDWYIMGKSITAKPFSYVPDPYIFTGQVADFMTGLRGYAFIWKGAGVLNPLSGSATFSTNIKFTSNGTNENVMFVINFGDGLGSGENLAVNPNANKFMLNFYEKNVTTNQYSLVQNISSTYTFNQRDGTVQNNFLNIQTIVNRLDFVGGRYTMETNLFNFNSSEIKVEIVPIYPLDILFLSFEVVTTFNDIGHEVDFGELI